MITMMACLRLHRATQRHAAATGLPVVVVVISAAFASFVVFRLTATVALQVMIETIYYYDEDDDVCKYVFRRACSDFHGGVKSTPKGVTFVRCAKLIWHFCTFWRICLG